MDEPIATSAIWTVIILLGLGTWLIRFSFLGMIGSRQMPEWALRHLRYVPVAIMPGIVAPLVAWPAATGGTLEPVRLIAVIVALLVGAYLRSTLGSIIAGLAVLYSLLAIVY